jgi:hypothetical protein
MMLPGSRGAAGGDREIGTATQMWLRAVNCSAIKDKKAYEDVPNCMDQRKSSIQPIKKV